MSLYKNSAIVIVGVITSNLLAYIFHFIAGRMLGPEDYGVLGAIMALFILVALPTGSLSYAISKSAAIFYSENKLSEIAILRKKVQYHMIILAGIIFGLVVIFSNIISVFLKIDSNIPVIMGGITSIFALLLPINRGILQALKKFSIFSWNSVMEAMTRVIFLVLFLYFGLGVKGAILAYSVGYMVAFVGIFPFIRELWQENRDADKVDIASMYKFFLQLLFANIFLQALLNIPTIFIKHYYSGEFTGYWIAAFNLARGSLFITGAISLVMFPEVSSIRNGLMQRKIFYRALSLVILFTTGIAFMFLIIPEFLITTLYGQSFINAVPILQWMGFVMILFSMLQISLDYYFAQHT